MNFTAITAVASAALALFVAVLARGVASAPGSGDQRPFSVVALASAAYSVCTLLTTGPASTELAVLLSRVHLASALVQLWGWLGFSQALLGLRPGRAVRTASSGLLAAAALALLPGLAFGERVVEHVHLTLGVVYLGGEPTRAGLLLMAVAAAAGAAVLLRFVRALRAETPYVKTFAAAFACLVACGANDMLTAAGVFEGLYLLDLGFAAPVLAMGRVITGRLVGSTLALEKLRGRLLADVEARTRELAATLEALHQVEKLAAVGQFANGVAHEVNSPAAVVLANLRYLEAVIRAGPLPPDAPEVARDALDAMTRISALVRKLVDAGRVAAVHGAPSVLSVAEVLARGAADARSGLPAGLAVEVDVPERLFVSARRESLEQVIASLLANAAEAIPDGRPGRIAVRGERSGTGVRITVADDGRGMPPDVLRRALDPFFSTKPGGRGAGLGLSVARGLVEAHGGALWLESTPGKGTMAFVELPEAASAPLRTPPPERPSLRDALDADAGETPLDHP